MLSISVRFGSSPHALMGALALAQLGLRKREEKGIVEWLLTAADSVAVACQFDAINAALAEFFPFPLFGSYPGVDALDLPWRLEMCAGNTALVEVTEYDRLLFRQVWLADARDLPRFAR